jgi:hypothetical protein
VLTREERYPRWSDSIVALLIICAFTALVVFGASIQAEGGEDGLCAQRGASSPGAPRVETAEATVSPNNSLIVNFDITVFPSAKVYVEYENTDAGRFQSGTTTSFGRSHTLSIVRLRQATSYCYQVFAEDTSGRVSTGMTGTFTTGPLPDV